MLTKTGIPIYMRKEDDLEGVQNSKNKKKRDEKAETKNSSNKSLKPKNRFLSDDEVYE